MKLILAWPGCAIARRLARELSCECSEIAIHGFPDGERLVRIAAEVAGRDVLIVASLDRADDKFLALAFACDAARELGARRVVLVAPYLAYMRQDTRFHPGEAVSSRTFARLISSVADALVTVDPHLHRWTRLSQIYSIPTCVAPAAAPIAQWIRQHAESPLLVGPDAESLQWVAEVARLANAPCIVLEKSRRGDLEVSVRASGELPSCRSTPVLIDDIASSGRTLVAAAGALRRAGLPTRMAVAVHALIGDEALSALRDAGIEIFVTSDTVEHATNAISVVRAIAQAVHEVDKWQSEMAAAWRAGRMSRA